MRRAPVADPFFAALGFLLASPLSGEQGSKTRPSPIRIGQVVTVSKVTAPSPISDTIYLQTRQ